MGLSREYRSRKRHHRPSHIEPPGVLAANQRVLDREG